jgi:pyruvate,water dikinase
VLKTHWTRQFSDVDMADVPIVGGKNASLGEMIRELGPLGIRVPGGYALTADAYRYFLKANDLETSIREAMAAPRIWLAS